MGCLIFRLFFLCFFFFFKQKTAYEMRISDWSSDVCSSDLPVMLGTALLAWSLGLRHAVDADHIAAIDNATRKLMQDGQQPLAVGFWFAIGHSGIVLIAAVLIAFAANAQIGRAHV